MDRSYGDKLRSQIREGRSLGADAASVGQPASSTLSPGIRPLKMDQE